MQEYQTSGSLVHRKFAKQRGGAKIRPDCDRKWLLDNNECLPKMSQKSEDNIGMRKLMANGAMILTGVSQADEDGLPAP